MHKVFISHHHGNDQWYKEKLVEFGGRYSIFVNRSVDTGDIPIPDEWTAQQIRREIRDRHLRDSTVTVVLVGRETRRRKPIPSRGEAERATVADAVFLVYEIMGKFAPFPTES